MLLRSTVFGTGLKTARSAKNKNYRQKNELICFNFQIFIIHYCVLFVEGNVPASPVPPILGWSQMQKMFPWNVVFLLGGGFALAEGATVRIFISDGMKVNSLFLHICSNMSSES